MVLDHLFEDIPDLRAHAFDHALRALDVVDDAPLDELLHDKRLKELEGHALRQAALVQLQVRPDHDHRAAGVVDALAQQVLTEAALLAFQHVRQALQLVVAGPRDGAAVAAVVDERVNCLLEHPLLIADDDLRRAELLESLKSVVPVNDATIQVVQVARGEAAAVELHHRTQIGREHRQNADDHPVGLVARLAESLEDPQALRRLLAALAGRGMRLAAQEDRQRVHIDGAEQVANGLGAHAGLEDAPAGLLQVPILSISQRLQDLDRLDLLDPSIDRRLFLLFALRDRGLDLLQLLLRLRADEVRLGAVELADVILLVFDQALDASDFLLEEPPQLGLMLRANSRVLLDEDGGRGFEDDVLSSGLADE